MVTTKSTENRFAHGLEYRPGRPMQLLRHEFGQIVINESALRTIEAINEPVGVISVVGSFRRGKSYFANVLHGRPDGFELGAAVHGCTRGVYMWDKPFMHNGKRVICLDTEGIGDPAQDPNWATKLFILCLALSSAFVYNINGILGRDDIGKLFLMTDLMKYLQSPKGCKFLPHLVILLRDFGLREPPDFQEWFLMEIRRTNEDAAEALKKFFDDFHVYALPHPGVFGDDLQNLESLGSHQLDRSFVSKASNAASTILENLNPKYIGPAAMSGTSLAKFIRDCVAQMNDPENRGELEIPTEYDAVIVHVDEKATKSAVRTYVDQMDDFTANVNRKPLSSRDFVRIHEQALHKAHKILFDKLIGSAATISEHEKKFQERVEELREEYKRKNSEALLKTNNEIAARCWSRFVASGLTVHNPFNLVDYNRAIVDFEFEYEMTKIPSPEAMTVLNQFRAREYPLAERELERCGQIQQSIAEQMRARREAEKQLLNVLAEEQELRDTVELQKKEVAEIEEQLMRKFEKILLNVKEQGITDRLEMERLRRENTELLEKVHEANQQKVIAVERKAKEKKQKYMRTLQRVGAVLGPIAGIACSLLTNGILPM